MPIISLITKIDAPIEICFDLSRSIDLHIHSSSHTQERAVDGVVSGLISANEYVTWQARHFGICLSLTSTITAFNRPLHFRDSMKSGPFKRLDHDHFFEFTDGMTVMRDEFDFNSPFGPIGHLVDALFLKKYLTEFLIKRNESIKLAAETNPTEFLSPP